MKNVEPRQDHHIWCNNGTWFIHLTVLWKEHHKVRVRKSLRTKNITEARRRRDRFIARLDRQADLTLPGVMSLDARVGGAVSRA